MNQTSRCPSEEREEKGTEENPKRARRSKTLKMGEEKMTKMGIECSTCGRPYDEAFFPRRIVQLSQRKGELVCPDQPKVRIIHQPQTVGTAYQWEVIHELEEEIEDLKKRMEVKELDETKTTKTKVSEKSEKREEEGRINVEEEDAKE